MKKLTAGIFAGILTIVAVNAANADIATTNYVKGAIESLDGSVDGNTGIVKTISQTDGKITATRGLITSDDVDAISQDKVTGLDTALAGKQATSNMVNPDADNNIAAGDSGSTTKYPSMKAAEKIAAAAAAEAVTAIAADITSVQNEIDKLKDNDPETEGSVANSIATAIGGLEAAEVTGVIKKISQTDGVISAESGKVAKTDLDTELSAEIDAKMATSAYNTATTMAADGTYAKKANTVGANLTALDTQVKTNADAIAALTGEGENSIKNQIDALADDVKDTTDALGQRLTTAEGKIDGLETDVAAAQETITSHTTSITNLTNNKANAADVYTKTEIDGKVDTITESIDGKVTATNLSNKLLTTTAAGQLQDASTGLTKPAECSNPGVTCMLVNDGTAFKWEKIVDTYTASAS